MFSSALVLVILAIGVLAMAGAAVGAVTVGRQDDERNANMGKK